VVKLGSFGDKNSFFGKLSINSLVGINLVHQGNWGRGCVILPARLFVVKLGPFGDKNSFVGKLSKNSFVGINPVHQGNCGRGCVTCPPFCGEVGTLWG
jgi:hypothetical protein